MFDRGQSIQSSVKVVVKVCGLDRLQLGPAAHLDMVVEHRSKTVLLNKWASRGATVIGMGKNDAAVQTC